MTVDDQLIEMLQENTRITTATACKLDAIAEKVDALSGLPERVAALEETAKARNASRDRWDRWLIPLLTGGGSLMALFAHSVVSWLQHLFSPHGHR